MADLMCKPDQSSYDGAVLGSKISIKSYYKRSKYYCFI